MAGNNDLLRAKSVGESGRRVGRGLVGTGWHSKAQHSSLGHYTVMLDSSTVRERLEVSRGHNLHMNFTYTQAHVQTRTDTNTQTHTRSRSHTQTRIPKIRHYNKGTMPGSSLIRHQI